MHASLRSIALLLALGSPLAAQPHAVPTPSDTVQLDTTSPSNAASFDRDFSIVDANPDACNNSDGPGDLPEQPFTPGQVPALHTRVTDMTGHLSLACTASLTGRMMALEKATGAQIAVLLIPTTGDEDIDAYANRVFHQWKLGRSGVDDGVLLVAAIEDHHARIEVGYGLEGTLTDAMAGDILRQEINPNFRDAHFDAGVSAAIDDLIARVGQGKLPPPKHRARKYIWLYAVFVILLSIGIGALCDRRHLRWYWYLILPSIGTAACALAAVSLHLVSTYSVALVFVPFSVLFSIAGIFVSRSARAVLDWFVLSLFITGALSLVVVFFGLSIHEPLLRLWPLFIASFIIGMFLALITVLVNANRSSGPRGHTSSAAYVGSSSSSSSDSTSFADTSSSSDSSSSDSFSGGGGDSGGGGASSDW